jgi:hypothetical protein
MKSPFFSKLARVVPLVLVVGAFFVGQLIARLIGTHRFLSAHLFYGVHEAHADVSSSSGSGAGGGDCDSCDTL